MSPHLDCDVCIQGTAACIQGTVACSLVYPQCPAQLQTQRRYSGRTHNVQLWGGMILFSEGKEAVWATSEGNLGGGRLPFLTY